MKPIFKHWKQLHLWINPEQWLILLGYCYNTFLFGNGTINHWSVEINEESRHFLFKKQKNKNNPTYLNYRYNMTAAKGRRRAHHQTSSHPTPICKVKWYIKESHRVNDLYLGFKPVMWSVKAWWAAPPSLQVVL